MHWRTALAFAAVIVAVTACDRDRNADKQGSGASRDSTTHSSGQGAGGPAGELTPASPSPDNTALTPEEQGASKADLEITRQIHRTITSDSEFSAEAKNVKVVTVNGKVTLRGSVSNVQEQRAIASVARRVAGVSAIDNQLEVKNNQ